MQIERLQLDLHPRPHWQAIDLGYALLRRNAATTYAAWWALWGPLSLLMLGLMLIMPGDWVWLPLFLLWWVKPLVERIAIYVLSRAVFDEAVTWRGALRAWPSQLSGGWFRLLVWWRLLILGRGLYQPIWQLERASGRFAADRRKALGRKGAYHAASWFGLVCAHFELILELGMIALLGLFFSDPEVVNPFILLMPNTNHGSQGFQALSFAVYALASGFIGPVYVAGCFTLYLNRRAELEAWDIELIFRRMAARRSTGQWPSKMASFLLVGLTALCCLLPTPVRAETCDQPEEYREMLEQRGAPHHAGQARLRADLDKLYTGENLRPYECRTIWVRKPTQEAASEPEEILQTGPAPDFTVVATLFKWLLIATALILIIWLLLRYRGLWTGLKETSKAEQALPQEIGGLDIRPESLPKDVASQVWQIWQTGEHRAALALLYRASLSRLIHQYGLNIVQGTTESECWRAARDAMFQQRLPEVSGKMIQDVTQTWLAAAYADRWPSNEQVHSLCQQWRQALDSQEAAA